MNRFLTLASLILCSFVLSSCSSDDIDDKDLSYTDILGSWTEDYSQYPYFAPEGYSTYTFGPDRKLSIHVYDVFAGDWDIEKHYFVGGEFGKNVIAINPFMSDYSGASYKIVKLTKNEMEWQRKGTTFTPGTVGSDFKHFVRTK